MRCSRDHHTINLLQADNANIHHLAFELRDEAEINRACDFLARKNIKLFWGPIRHLIGHNIAIYHKNPDGITVEFFTDIDLMFDEELGYFEPRPWHQDRPQRPNDGGDGTLSNWWGPMSHSPNRTHPGHSDTDTPAKRPEVAVAAKVRVAKKTGKPGKAADKPQQERR